MGKRLDLSLILACFNEGPTLNSSLEKISNVLNDTNYSYEVICIDDKSIDNTLNIVEKFVKNKNNWKVFSHGKNKGRGATVKEGILMAKGEVVGYIDVDLEVSASYIPEFVSQVRNRFDVAIATRVYKIALHNLIRSLSTVVYVTLSRMILQHNLEDTEAGYKFFLRKSVLDVIKKCQDNHWFFDTEVLMRSLDNKLKIEQIPVLFLKRQDKKSTVRLVSDTLKYLKALINFKRDR